MSSDNLHTRVEALLAFVTKLRGELLELRPPDPRLPGETTHALGEYTSQIPLFEPSLPLPHRRRFDEEGVNLWNHCARLSLSPGDHAFSKQISNVKALAFGLLETARRTEASETLNIVDVALSAARDCTESGVLDKSQRIIEIIAMKLDTLKSKPCPDYSRTQSLEIEYYMIRIHLAWCQGRADIADHLYSQVPRTAQNNDWITIMEMTYKIGDLALSSHRHDIAVKWSERALRACEAWTDDAQKHGQPSDQKMLILHQYVRAKLNGDEPGSGKSIQPALDALKKEYSTAFPVMVLRLEALRRGQDPDWKEYIQVLHSAIGTMDLASNTVKIVLHYILPLRYSSPQALLDGFKRLLIERLLPSCNKELFETAIVSFIWSLTVSECCSPSVLDVLQEGMKNLDRARFDTVSEAATDACLLAIWKHVDKEISKRNYLIAGKWCHFVLEQMIFQITLDNKDKFMRKLIVCALNSGETSNVYDAFDSLPDGLKNSPSILYLMYKLALQDNQSSKGSVYLDLLFSQVEGCSYLVACTYDALKQGEARLAAKCLGRTIEKYNNCRFEGSDVAKLLQCVLFSLTERSDSLQGGEFLLTQTLSIFEAALMQGDRAEDKVLLSHIEPGLFAEKFYTIALKAVKSSHLDLAVWLLDLSIQSTETRQKAESQEDRSDIYERYLTYDTLRATAIMALARKERDQSTQQQLYTRARQSTHRFRTSLQNLQSRRTAESVNAWFHKYRMMLSIDFEALIGLNDWESAVRIVQESAAVINDKLAAVFLDCVLRSAAPESGMASIVKTVLRTLHTHAEPSMTDPLIPRYLHILFHLAITASDDALAELVLDQALSLARRSNDSLSTRYPDDEIHWLASVAFNHAVDFYLVAADEDCHRWAQKVIELADCIDDEVSCGMLGGLLREKYTRLT